MVKRLLVPLAQILEKRAVVHPLYACVLLFYFLKGLNDSEKKREI